MNLEAEVLLKIILAMFAGGLLGLEREIRDKAAGFRTLIFICAGATLYTIFSTELSGDYDPTRIAANIVVGVGFLGAGVILREGGHVTGLTTASTIWLTAALGMGLGAGKYTITGFALLIGLVVLWFFPKLELAIDNVRQERTYEIVFSLSLEKQQSLEALIRDCGLRIRRHRQMREGDRMVCSWRVSGSRSRHEQLVQQLFTDQEVIAFRY